MRAVWLALVQALRTCLLRIRPSAQSSLPAGLCSTLQIPLSAPTLLLRETHTVRFMGPTYTVTVLSMPVLEQPKLCSALTGLLAGILVWAECRFWPAAWPAEKFTLARWMLTRITRLNLPPHPGKWRGLTRPRDTWASGSQTLHTR